MKKLLVILLMLGYGYSAAGMTLQLHYCCGKLKSIEWSPVAANECGEKHNMGSKPCCETKTLISSKSPDQESSLAVPLTANFVKEPVTVYSDPLPANILSTPIVYQRLDHPPPQWAPPLFIQFCVFRI
jgi:hypothetical protein